MPIDSISAAGAAAPTAAPGAPSTDPTAEARASIAQLAQAYGISRDSARRVQQQVLMQHPELSGAALQQALGQAAALAARAGSSADSFQRGGAAAAGSSAQLGAARTGPSPTQLAQVARDAAAGPVLPAPKVGQPDLGQVRTALPKMSFGEMADGHINWTALSFFVNKERMEHFYDLLKQQQVVSRATTAVNLASSLTQALLTQVQVLSEQTKTIIGSGINPLIEAQTDLARTAGGRLVGSDPISPLENLDIAQTPKNQSARGSMVNQKRQRAITELAGLQPPSTLGPAAEQGSHYAIERDGAHATQAARQQTLAQAAGAPAGGAAPNQVIGMHTYPGGRKLSRSFLSPQEISLLSPTNQEHYGKMMMDFKVRHDNSVLAKEGMLSHEVGVLKQAAAEARAAAAEARAGGDLAQAAAREAWADVHQARAASLAPQVDTARAELGFLVAQAYTNHWGLGEGQLKLAEISGLRQRAEDEARQASAQRVVARPAGAPDSGVDALKAKAELAHGIEFEQNIQVAAQAKLLARFGKGQLLKWRTEELQEGYHGRLAELQKGREAVAKATGPQAKEEADRQLALTQAGIRAFRQTAPPPVVSLLDLTRLSDTAASRQTYAATIDHIVATRPPDAQLARTHMLALESQAQARQREAEGKKDAAGAQKAGDELARLRDQRAYLDGLLRGPRAAAPNTSAASFSLTRRPSAGSAGRARGAANGASASQLAAKQPIVRAADAGLDNLHRFDQLAVPYAPPRTGTPDEQLATHQAFTREAARADATASAAAALAFRYEGFKGAKVLQQVLPVASDLSKVVDTTNNSAQSLSAGAAGLAASFTPELDQAFLRAYQQMQGMFYQLNALASRNVLHD